MKIAFFLDYFQPKLGYSEYYVARELQKNGHTVEIIASDRYFPFPDYAASVHKFLGNRIRKPGFSKEHGLPVYREKTFLELFARVMYGNQKKHLDRFYPDTVIVNGSTTWNAIILSFLKKTYGFRLISFDSHLPSELLRGNTQAKNVFYFIFRFLFSPLINAAVNKFIAVQKDTKTIMRTYYGIKKNIALIPLGTDTGIFSFRRAERNRIRKKYHLTAGDFVLLYSGKIVEAKRVDLLFGAFNELAQKRSNIKLMLVGEGPANYIRRCYSLVKTVYRRNIIRIPLKKQADLARYYSCADIGVWPAQESTSIYDALACKLHVIVNNTIRGPVRTYTRAFQPDNPLDLCRKIEYVYNHRKQFRKDMGVFNEVRSLYSWTAIAKEYIK